MADTDYIDDNLKQGFKIEMKKFFRNTLSM